MTIPATARKAGPFIGDGITVAIPFGFRVFSVYDLKVVQSTPNGAAITLAPGAGYVVYLNADQSSSPGGNVVFTTPIPVGVRTSVLGNIPYSQTIRVPNSGSFKPELHESAFDRLTMQLQQIVEELSRAIVGSPLGGAQLVFPAPSAGRFIRWNPAGSGFENADATDNPGLQGLLASAAGGGAVNSQAFSDVTAAIRSLADRLDDSLDIRAYGAKGDRVTVDTISLLKVFVKARLLGLTVVDHKGGQFLTGPLDGNGASRPANAEWDCLRGLRGAGRFTTIFVAQPGAYAPEDWILRCRNVSAGSYHDFGYDGAGVAQQGFDFSWTGGSEGNASIAPSTGGTYSGMFGRGVSGWGFNFDQCYDSTISGISSEGVGSGNIAISLNGAGGQIYANNLRSATGRTQIGCQNGGISDSQFFHGIELTGSGFNNMRFSNCHLYPNPNTSVLINSTAAGNATRGVEWSGCFFNDTPGWVIAGAFHQGMKFTACQFGTYGQAFFAAISPAAGAGSPPMFDFEFSSFSGPHPVDVPGQALVSHYESRPPTGGSFTSVRMRGLLTTDSASIVALRAGTMVTGPAGATPTSGSGMDNQVGVFRHSANNGGQVAGTTAGATIMYNPSGGRGEVALSYAGGGGADPSFDVVNATGTPSIALQVRNISLLPGADNTMSGGSADRRFTQIFASTSSINTSDRRSKQDIDPIREAILDAWGEVEYVQYRFIDAVVEKGDGARWHFGAVAQQIEDVCSKRGLDPFALGVLCWDKWDDEFDTVPAVMQQKVGPYPAKMVAAQEPIGAVFEEIEEPAVFNNEGVQVAPARKIQGRMLAAPYMRDLLDDSGKVVMREAEPAGEGPLFDDAGEPIMEEISPARTVLVRPAGDRYGIRYEYAMVIEAAYQRRRMGRIEARLNGGTL